MFFIYIFYKCNDGKMVILENNYVLIKLDIVEIDIIIMIFKVIVILIWIFLKCMLLYGYEF